MHYLIVMDDGGSGDGYDAAASWMINTFNFI